MLTLVSWVYMQLRSVNGVVEVNGQRYDRSLAVKLRASGAAGELLDMAERFVKDGALPVDVLRWLYREARFPMPKRTACGGPLKMGKETDWLDWLLSIRISNDLIHFCVSGVTEVERKTLQYTLDHMKYTAKAGQLGF